MPFPYPLEEVPDGYLAFDGKRFKKERYPKLAKIYKSCALPDLRGKFIRGLGGNSGALLEIQPEEIKKHSHNVCIHTTLLSSTPGSSPNWGHIDNISYGGDTGYASGSWLRVWEGSDSYNGEETRPENVAFQYICWSGEYYV